MKYGFIAIVLLVATYSLGPKVDFDESIRPVQLTNDLDKYITAKESQINGLRAGTEKKIVWADPANRVRTPLAIIYIHGFSASRQEVAPLADRIASALNANLYYTRLPGHGRDNQAMALATVNAMLNDSNEALLIGQKLGQRVIIIASSTGATLATLTALNAALDTQQSILALVLLSPNFGVKRSESELLLMPWAETIVGLVEGPTYRYEAQNELQRRYWTTAYPSSALIQMMGLIKLVRNKPIEEIKQPVMILYSPDDQILDINSLKKTFERFASVKKQIVAINNPGDKQKHTLAGDALSPGTTPEVFNNIMQFLNAQLEQE